MEIDNKKYKKITWKNPMVLHWIINPGIMINELVMGIRVPKLMLKDTTPGKAFTEKYYVPCPHCYTIHSDKTWSGINKTGFKNWFGLYCPTCRQVIPCLMNATTFIILAVTYPVWGWFKNRLKQAWLQRQPERFRHIDLQSSYNPYMGNGWIKYGVNFGMFLYLYEAFISPWIFHEPITWVKSLWMLPYALGVGLLVAYLAKKLFNNPAAKDSGSSN